MFDWCDHPWLLGILIVVNFPVYRKLMACFVGDTDGLKESLRYLLTPDIVSAFRGEYREDRWATVKICFFVVACILAVAAEYAGLSRVLAWVHA